MRIARPQQVECLVEILDAHAELLGQRRGRKPTELVEPFLHELLHVLLAHKAARRKLHGKPLAQVAHGDAHGVEPLDQGEHVGDFGLGASCRPCDVVDRQLQVAIAVEAAHDELAHGDAERIVFLQAQLLDEMFGERLALNEVVVPREPGGIRRAGAARAAAPRAAVACATTTTLLSGEVRSAGIRVGALRAGAVPVVVRRAFARRRKRRARKRVGAHRARIRVGFVGMTRVQPVVIVEKRILLHALLHVVAQLDGRHLHDLDPLAQLGREVKLLASLHVLTEIHEAPYSMSFVLYALLEPAGLKRRQSYRLRQPAKPPTLSASTYHIYM